MNNLDANSNGLATYVYVDVPRFEVSSVECNIGIVRMEPEEWNIHRIGSVEWNMRSGVVQSQP